MSSKAQRVTCCLIASLCFAAVTANATTLTVDPTLQTIALGSQANVTIRISDLGDLVAPSLGTFDINISYVPTILQFDHAVYGDSVLGDQLDLFGLGSLISTTAGVGTVNLFELSFDASSDLNDLQRGAFGLVSLVFNTVGGGNSLLEISINALGDADGNALPADFIGGRVTVLPASTTPVPEPITLLLVGPPMIFGLLRQRRRSRL